MLWYAAYGSNLSLARFRLYLDGGKPFDNAREYPPCPAGSVITGDKAFPIDRQLYFAGKSKQWGAGVAFVDFPVVDPPPTLGRAYRLSLDQLTHVARQENGGREVLVDVERIGKQPLEIRPHGYYRILLPLGQLDGDMVVTLTGRRDERGHDTRPSEAYLDWFRSGLWETYPDLKAAAIDAYLNKHLPRV